MWRRLRTRTRASFLLYRYRYLAAFTVIGFLSIVLELLLVRVLPADWPTVAKLVLGFAAGLVFSFALNFRFNFQVPRAYLLTTFRRFAAVSCLSFLLNLAVMSAVKSSLTEGYAPARLLSAGVLFMVAYTLHRRYTFRLARDFGVAVYATKTERVGRIYRKIGWNCDHVHVDLVDETMNPAAAPVDLTKLDRVRRLWKGVPVCLHVMSLQPGRWLPHVWDRVDWVVVHANAEEDLVALIAEARMRGKKVGVAWHVSTTVAAVLPHLPHVDFAMVLGIAQPGVSGQKLLEEAVTVAHMLDRERHRYGFEIIFDGGVNPATIARIPAKYVVAANAVIADQDPVRAAHTLRTGAVYARRAA